VWYYDAGDFPEPKRHLGRWLGEATHIGHAMCYYILPISGVPIIRSSVQLVSDADKMIDEVKQELQQLNQAITEKLGSYTSDKDESIPDYFNLQVMNDNTEDDESITPNFEPMEEGIQEDYDPEILDQYLAAQVQLPLGDDLVLGQVIASTSWEQLKDMKHGFPSQTAEYAMSR
jgi:hypothetical protein